MTGIFGKAAGLKDAEAEHRAAEAVRSVFARFQPVWQPVPRPGLPQDVAAAALFLESDAAIFINGQDVAVGGGITAGRPFLGCQCRLKFSRHSQSSWPAAANPLR